MLAQCNCGELLGGDEMDEAKAKEKFKKVLLHFVSKDGNIGDALEYFFLKGFRYGYAEGSADAHRKTSPEPDEEVKGSA